MATKERKQRLAYGVYYVGAPYGLTAIGELWYETNDLERAHRWKADHDYKFHGTNGVIRDKNGHRVS